MVSSFGNWITSVLYMISVGSWTLSVICGFEEDFLDICAVEVSGGAGSETCLILMSYWRFCNTGQHGHTAGSVSNEGNGIFQNANTATKFTIF